MINEVLKYLHKGISVIPVKPDKRPILPSWKEFQGRVPTETEIKNWYLAWPDSGIAVVTGSISGVVVIDIDDQDKSEIWDLIPYDPAIIPTAKTPSGGLHLWFRAPRTNIGNNAKIVPGCDFRGEGGYVLVPPSPGYEWLPGQSIFEIEAPELPQKYIDFVTKRSVTPVAINLESKEVFIPQGERDDRLFHLANRLFRGGATEDEVRRDLRIFGGACNPPFPEKELEIKIDSAMKRRGIRNISEEIEKWVLLLDSDFSVSNCYRELQLVTKQDMGAARQAILRLKDREIIKQVGTRGHYRRVQKDFEELDPTEQVADPLEISWPLGIESFYMTLPKTIAVIAGTSGVGKSTFCFNFALLNKDRMKVNYFSSEMGIPELQRRLQKFHLPMDTWGKIRFAGVSSNYADAIEPDEINIIDFMEIHDEFWQISNWINEIFRKLDHGMCLIALQKFKGKDVAKGGEGTLEKPRIYLTMDRNPTTTGGGVMKVVKCHNWATDDNPWGKIRMFNIKDGAKLEPFPGSSWEDDLRGLK